MRCLFFVAAILACSVVSNAQKKKDADPNLPPFGSVSKEDLLMKECNFDEKAEALMLVEDGVLEYSPHEGLEMKRRIRIKILNNDGLDWANVHLPFLSEHAAQIINSIEAQTYNLDASGNIVVTKLDRKLIYEKKLNKKWTEKVFTLPEVKVGSVIEYRYKHVGIGLIDWYFQRSIPVRYSHFTIEMPDQIDVSVIPYASRPIASDRKTKATNVIRSFSMSQVPAFRNEPYIINEDYYRDRLVTKLVAFMENGRKTGRIVTWPQVIRYLMEDEDFGLQVKKNIPRTADLDALLLKVNSPYEKMKIIYKYVQSNMEWNEYLGIWALDGVKSAWKDKKGTVGEINLILVNLLKDAGLDAHPLLVSTHHNGVVNPLDAGTVEYPGFNQFDKVMACINLGDTKYILDATQKNMPVHLIPSDVVATQGLVISKLDTYEWGWISLMKPEAIAKNLTMINASIDSTGLMKGEVVINSYDYARVDRFPTAKKGKDKFIAQYISKSNPGLEVEDVAFENMEDDSLPLIQKVKFAQPLNSAGDYHYFSANMLSGLEQNPFVADSRFSDVFFGRGQSYTIIANYMIPDGFEPEQLPKNLRMIMPDTSIMASRISQASGNLIQARIQVEFKKAIYPASQYPDLQEFYKMLYDMLNEQFVIKRKTNQS